jgi:hypothetical protein
MRVLAALFVVSLVLVNPYLRGDGNGYYAWLRSPLIDGDVHFGNEYLRADPQFRDGFVDAEGRPTTQMTTASGKVENQWSIGPALLWLPFFAAAHLLALAGAGTPDGYAPIYLWLVALGTALYGFGALVLGIALARAMGAARWAVAAAAAVLGASSLPVYMYLLPFHVHALAAFASGLFFWWGLLRVEGWRPRVWAVWGALAGLMLAVYFVHAVFLVAVVWRLAARGAAREKIAAAAAFAAGALPFAVLHLASRYALYGSFTTGYRDEFFWLSPRLLATALSAEHGLFLWTPVVAIALVGLVALARRDPRARVVLAAWALLFYVIASYQNWHGQSSFGNRFFVSLAPVFVPGIAVALAWMHARARLLPAAVIAVLCLWNAGFVFQWGLNIVPNRGPVDFRHVARNQVTVVPARIGSTAVRYFTARGRFTREVEADDLREREDYRLRR